MRVYVSEFGERERIGGGVTEREREYEERGKRGNGRLDHSYLTLISPCFSPSVRFQQATVP